LGKDHHVTHLEPGIGRGGKEEAGEALDGVREGGKKNLTHAGLEEEHHVTHLEPGIGRGGKEEAGEAPDGVREGDKIYPTQDWTRSTI
jgi:hypothetical protein